MPSYKQLITCITGCVQQRMRTFVLLVSCAVATLANAQEAALANLLHQALGEAEAAPVKQVLCDALAQLNGTHPDSTVALISAHRDRLTAALPANLATALFLAGGRDAAFVYERYPESIDLLQQVRTVAKEHGNSQDELAALQGIVESYFRLFDAEHTLSLATEGIMLATETKDTSAQFSFLRQAGEALEVREEWDDAIEYYNRALAVAEQMGSNEGKFAVRLNIAIAYYKRGEGRKGLALIEPCYAMASGNDSLIAIADLWAGSMHSALRELDTAEAKLLRAGKVFERLGLRDRAVHVKLERARLALRAGEYSRVAPLVDSGLTIVGDQRTPYHVLFATELRYSAYKHTGNYKDGMLQLEQLVALRAHLDSVNNTREIRSLVRNFESLEQQQTIERQRATIAKRRYLVVALALAVGLLTLALYGVYTLMQRRKELVSRNRLIARQADELRKLDKAKSDFFANVSHELRTPVSLVLGPVRSVLRRGKVDARDARLLASAERGAGDLLALTTSLLDLSRVDAGQVELYRQPTLLEPFVREVALSFEPTAVERNIRLTLAYRAPTELCVALDADKVRVILRNLLANALRFTGSGGTVALAVDHRAGRLIFAVADDGRGVDASEHDLIFERYYQARADSGPLAGGTGIGLALVKKYAVLLGGDVQVRSSLGEGATFTVSIEGDEVLSSEQVDATVPQLEAVIDTEEIAPLSTGVPVASTAAQVLIVEDNAGLREYLAAVLGEHYHVQTAEHGLRALQLIEAAAPALVLTDWMMPEMDGYELIARLRGSDATRHIPVIMLTARSHSQARNRVLRAGVDDYLVKPVDEVVLLHRIAELLSHQQVRQEATAAEASSGAEADSNQVGEPQLSAHDAAWLEEFEAYIRLHLGDASLNLPRIAFELATSESTLLRQVKRLVGLTPARYLQEVRLAEARALLEAGTCDSVGDVARAVGYTNARTFTRNFKQQYGISPANLLSVSEAI